MSEADLRSLFEQQNRLKALHRLADNHAHDWARRQRTYDRYCGADLFDPDAERCLHRRSAEERSLYEHLIRQEKNARLHRTLNTLTPSERQLLHAYYWQQGTMDAIATRLGVPSAAIRKRFSRLHKRLNTRLQAMGWETH